MHQQPTQGVLFFRMLKTFSLYWLNVFALEGGKGVKNFSIKRAQVDTKKSY